MATNRAGNQAARQPGDLRARRSARQLLCAELPTPAVFEALRGTIGDVLAMQTMRELLAEDRAAAEARDLAMKSTHP